MLCHGRPAADARHFGVSAGVILSSIAEARPDHDEETAEDSAREQRRVRVPCPVEITIAIADCDRRGHTNC